MLHRNINSIIVSMLLNFSEESMKFNPNTHNSELSSAYIEFASSMVKTTVELYAKTWEETIKLQSALTKNTAEFYKDFPLYKSITEMYSSSPWTK